MDICAFRYRSCFPVVHVSRSLLFGLCYSAPQESFCYIQASVMKVVLRLCALEDDKGSSQEIVNFFEMTSNSCVSMIK